MWHLSRQKSEDYMLHVYHPVAPSQEITVQPAGLQQCIKASQPLISLLLDLALWLPFFSSLPPVWKSQSSQRGWLWRGKTSH